LTGAQTDLTGAQWLDLTGAQWFDDECLLWMLTPFLMPRQADVVKSVWETNSLTFFTFLIGILCATSVLAQAFSEWTTL